jgi:uncharacterized tellurite resistance protein B-like protein
MTKKQHDARDLPLTERVDYLMVVASMAGADVVIDQAEKDRLRELCGELGLPERETAAVLSACQRPTASIERHIDGLKSSPLRFTLLSDCVSLAYADGDYGKDERREVESLARALGVSGEQLAPIEELVRATHAAATGGADDHHKAGLAIAEKLAAVGVPIGAVAAISAVGLEMAGVSTGVAALGVGLGIATGFGAVLGIGVGSYMGVRWLKGKLKHDAG